MNTKNLIIVLFLFPVCLFAQLEKGNTTLGGSAGLNFYPNNGNNGFILGVMPSKTWFVTDALEVGGSVGLEFFHSDNFGGGIYRIAPMLNYYFNPAASGFRYFAFMEAGIIGSFGNFDGDTDAFLGFGVGGLSFLNENVAFQTRLGYSYRDADGIHLSTISLQADLKAFLSNSSEEEEGEESKALSAGTLLIGGTSVNIAYTFFEFGDNNINDTDIDINLKALYLFSEQFAAGGGIHMGSISGDNRDAVFTFGLLPVARYYFNPISNNPGANFFGTITTGIQHLKLGDFKETWVTFNFGVGTNVFIAQNIAIEGILSYGYQENRLSAGGDNSRFGANVLVQYFWNR